jgi:hypothetical protein
VESTHNLILTGIQNLQENHKKTEESKRGILRVGTSGALLPDGKTVGKCMRLALLRALGIDGDIENTSREFMFAAGRTNEESWMEKLQASGLPLERIKREEEWPVSWTLDSGRRVTGRPDFVLLDAEGKPERGLELKLVSSLWTGRDVLLKGRPKMEHVLQASHYMWKVGAPFEIWYTNRAIFQLPYMKNVPWPRRDSELARYFDYSDEDDLPRSMIPFSVGFELRQGAENLEFRPLLHGNTKDWVKTPVSLKSIEEWYKELDKYMDPLYNNGALPPRPVSLLADGDKKSSKQCDYCPLAQVCDKREDKGRVVWVSEVKNWLGRLPMGGSILTK